MGTTVEVASFTVERAGRPAVSGRVCELVGARKRKRFFYWWGEAGKGYSGFHPVGWFATADEAQDAVRARFRPSKGGLSWKEVRGARA